MCRGESVFERGGAGHGDAVERRRERAREGEHVFDETGPEDAGGEDVDEAICIAHCQLGYGSDRGLS